MKILISEVSEKFLQKLEKKFRDAIIAKLKILSENQSSEKLDIKKLKGFPKKPVPFRLRVGDFRIIYFMGDEKIWVTEIFRRGQEYRN